MFPAYAGMIPVSGSLSTIFGDVPRIRGDDPQGIAGTTAREGMFPAYAGMILIQLHKVSATLHVPRIRGDDPALVEDGKRVIICSPHTRG